MHVIYGGPKDLNIGFKAYNTYFDISAPFTSVSITMHGTVCPLSEFYNCTLRSSRILHGDDGDNGIWYKFYDCKFEQHFSSATVSDAEERKINYMWGGAGNQYLATTGNVNLNDLASKGLSTNFGIPSSSSSNAVSYANAQSSSSSYNTYGATKTTFTKETKSYVGPTQSYSYQYSYNMPATGSTTVTKTTYTGVAPGTSPK